MPCSASNGRTVLNWSSVPSSKVRLTTVPVSGAPFATVSCRTLAGPVLWQAVSARTTASSSRLRTGPDSDQCGRDEGHRALALRGDVEADAALLEPRVEGHP